MYLVLLKITRVVLILLGIYFALGLIASIVLLLIELATNKMSVEILKEQPNFNSSIIYIGLSVFAFTCVGISFVCFFGASAINKKLKEF